MPLTKSKIETGLDIIELDLTEMMSIVDISAETMEEKQREIRNKITHPHAKKGHLNPTDIYAIRTLEADLPLLQKLVKILLENPPSSNL